jgi:hypothetical protein
MKKNIVQDVIPGKKSIRNIDVGSRSKKIIEIDNATPTPRKETPAKKEIPLKINRSIPQKESAPLYSYDYDTPKKSSRKALYIAVGIFVLALLFGISALFKGAKITLTPKQDTKALNETFTAKKDVTTAGLGFQLVTTAKDLEKTVEATGEERVDKKASGKIVIYNNTTASQKLIATTRFQTPEGLIFRIVNPVTVPAKSVKDGKTVAGSVEATVEADKAGVEYNIPLKDFTIPGFKGDAKYTQIYGRSKTEMTGGFSGMQKVVSKDVMTAAEKELEESLKVQLAKDIITQIPENFVLYNNSLSYKFDPVTQVNSSTGGAVLHKRGTTSGVIFDKGALSRVIIGKLLPAETNSVIKITNLQDLSFSFASSTGFDPNTSTNIAFSLKGAPNFVWVFDENKLKTDLLGLSKKNAKIVIGTYGTIKEAWVETYPFWNGTIPTDPNKVKLINTLTK